MVPDRFTLPSAKIVTVLSVDSVVSRRTALTLHPAVADSRAQHPMLCPRKEERMGSSRYHNGRGLRNGDSAPFKNERRWEV